jgi:hypothetical protein
VSGAVRGQKIFAGEKIFFFVSSSPFRSIVARLEWSPPQPPRDAPIVTLVGHIESFSPPLHDGIARLQIYAPRR